MSKICSKCGHEYRNLEKSFHKKTGTADGFQARCKKCVAEFHKTHYQKNQQYYKEKALRNKNIARERIQNFILDYLGNHPCVDCGEADIIVLDFDHVYGKKESIGVLLKNGVSLATIQKEIEKCEVRCANCHRRKTAKDFGWYRLKMPL